MSTDFYSLKVITYSDLSGHYVENAILSQFFNIIYFSVMICQLHCDRDIYINIYQLVSVKVICQVAASNNHCHSS